MEQTIPTSSRLTLFPIIITAFLVLFAASSFRHWSFCSSAFDLGIFDQALWQLSVGESTFASLINRHILSDHGAFILYPLAMLYKILPSVYLLFLIQSFMLAMGAYTLWLLGRHYKLAYQHQVLAPLTYLLHPVLFNVNLFDFHPEVIGVPFLPLLVLFAERRQLLFFVAVAMTIMSCKEVLALTIVATGCYLFYQRNYRYGAIAVIGGLLWFYVVTQIVMPGVPGGTHGAAFSRYSYLGSTLPEMIKTLLLSPWLVFEHIEPLKVAKYILQLFLPCLWIFGRRSLPLLLIAAPTIILNVLSTLKLQLSLHFQYSLPVLPVVGMMVIARCRDGQLFPAWLSPHNILIWLTLNFILPLVAGNIKHPGRHPSCWYPQGNTSDMYHAVAIPSADASIYASARIIPHMSQRLDLRVISALDTSARATSYDYTLIDRTGSEEKIHNAFNAKLRERLLHHKDFALLYDTPTVSIFRNQQKISK